MRFQRTDLLANRRTAHVQDFGQRAARKLSMRAAASNARSQFSDGMIRPAMGSRISPALPQQQENELPNSEVVGQRSSMLQRGSRGAS